MKMNIQERIKKAQEHIWADEAIRKAKEKRKIKNKKRKQHWTGRR